MSYDRADMKASARRERVGRAGESDGDDEGHGSQKPGQGPILRRRKLERCGQEMRESQLESKLRTLLRTSMNTTLEV